MNSEDIKAEKDKWLKFAECLLETNKKRQINVFEGRPSIATLANAVCSRFKLPKTRASVIKKYLSKHLRM